MIKKRGHNTFELYTGDQKRFRMLCDTNRTRLASILDNIMCVVDDAHKDNVLKKQIMFIWSLYFDQE